MKMKKRCIKVAAALIKINGKILLARRAKGELKDYWEFPGGKIEDRETPQETIIREIKEEMNLEVHPINIAGTFRHEYDFALIEMTLIECEITGKEKIVLDGSHSEYKWVDVKNEKINLTPLDSKIIISIIRN